MTDAWAAVLKWGLSVLTTIVAGVVGIVLRNHVKVARLEERVKDLEEASLTKEDVREVIESALAKRDKIATERRQEWEKRLPLEIRTAVTEGVKECARGRDASGTGRV